MAKTFYQVLKKHYEEIPAAMAVHLLYNNQPTRDVTCRDLILGSAGYAHALEEAGVKAGEVVILILQHGEDLIYAFFGAILHGAIPSIMPFLTEKLSPEKYRQSLVALFEITTPTAVVTYPEFLPEVRQAIRSATSVPAILVSTDIHPSASVDFATLHGYDRTPDDIVLLQHSSGTTGLQKGVALSNRAVFNQLDSYTKALSLNSKDVVVSWLPLYHDMGLIAGFILPILCQVPLVLMSPFDWVRAPHKLLEAVTRYRGTLSWLPNFAYNFCAQKIRNRDLEGIDLSSWRAVINCSEPMYLKSHQLFAHRFEAYGLRPEALATCYAMAENVFAVTQGGINEPVSIDKINRSIYFSERVARPCTEDELAISMLSAGKPMDNTKIRVLDDRRVDVPQRQIGEIALQSNCMLTGYYNRADLTAKALIDGWYLTGDLGYLADGELYITGRKKDLIIVGGKNIYPQDLENLASEVPGIHPGRVAAFGIPNEETGTEDVVIVAEVDEDYGPPGNTSQEAFKTRLADEIRQHVTRGSDIALRYVNVVNRGWLLKTSSGKVARSANRDKYIAETPL